MIRIATVLGSVALVATLAASASAVDYRRVHEGTETIHVTAPSDTDGGCGTLLMSADGTYENGYGWDYAGVVPPYYGAFAECYSGTNVTVCSAEFDFSGSGWQVDETMDVYVWGDDGGKPGAVRCAKFDVDPGPVAFWPEISHHSVPMGCDCLDGTFWVGYWGNWPGQGEPSWFIAVDLNGLGGCSFTNIAPGIGFPTGWNDVSVVFGPSSNRSLGIGCEVVSCNPVPTRDASWGAVKSLYRN